MRVFRGQVRQIPFLLRVRRKAAVSAECRMEGGEGRVGCKEWERKNAAGRGDVWRL